MCTKVKYPEPWTRTWSGQTETVDGFWYQFKSTMKGNLVETVTYVRTKKETPEVYKVLAWQVMDSSTTYAVAHDPEGNIKLLNCRDVLICCSEEKSQKEKDIEDFLKLYEKVKYINKDPNLEKKIFCVQPTYFRNEKSAVTRHKWLDRMASEVSKYENRKELKPL